jgi:hypothetical protein
MTKYFFMTPAIDPGGAAISPPCASIEEALRGANFMLGNGAASAWIIDGEGNLVLPADQVRLRLNPPDPASGPAPIPPKHRRRQRPL